MRVPIGKRCLHAEFSEPQRFRLSVMESRRANAPGTSPTAPCNNIIYGPSVTLQNHDLKTSFLNAASPLFSTSNRWTRLQITAGANTRSATVTSEDLGVSIGRGSPAHALLRASRGVEAGRQLALPQDSSGGPSSSSRNSTFPSSGVGVTPWRVAVGIDLGTTTSAVAVTGPDGRPVVVEDEEGRAVIPSVVTVRPDGTVLVGEEAAAAAESDPTNTFYGIKRLMGRTYREAVREVDEVDVRARLSKSASASSTSTSAVMKSAGIMSGPGTRRLRSYSLVEGPRGTVQVSCPALGRNLTPQEISSHLLRHLVSRARRFIERQIQSHQQSQHQQPGSADADSNATTSAVKVLDAVITVPAHFGPAQRRAVSEAATAAGLQRVTLLQEPIAAAMAYGFGSHQVPYDVLLVFDLGGGTLDLSLVEAFEGIMEVLATTGDNFLGGDDFTAAVADWLAEHQQQLLLLQQQQEEEPSSHLQGTPPPHQHQNDPQRIHPHANPVMTIATPASTTSILELTSPFCTELPPSSSSPAPSDPCSSLSPGCSPISSSRSLALLRAAEAAKLLLSEAAAAAAAAIDRSRTGSPSTDTDSWNRQGSSRVSVRVRVPDVLDGSEMDGTIPGRAMEARENEGCVPFSNASTTMRSVEMELSSEKFEELVRPLLHRMWWPLEELALATRTQLGGRLPPHLDPRESESSGSSDPCLSAGSSGNMEEGPGRREGAAAWKFSIFSPASGNSGGEGGAAATKYVAPPRRLSGLVLVGAATRLPVVREYITEVTGLPIRPGVDPETAVALGAALHAGLMVGSVTRGIEMNDGSYVSGQHGRASGFQVAAASESDDRADALTDVEPELVWEP